MDFVVARVTKSGRVLEYHRSHGDSCVIGRGFDCDFLLFDPHVSQFHAQIIRTDEGQWRVVDLNSVNGFRIGRRRYKRGEVAKIEPGEMLTIGHTQVIFFPEDQPIPQALPLKPVDELAYLVSSHAVFWPFMVLASLILMWVEWQSSYADIGTMELLQRGLYSVMVGFAWATVFAAVSFYFRQETRFKIHCFFALIAVVAVKIIGIPLIVFAANLASDTAVLLLKYAVLMAVLFSLLTLSVRFAMRQFKKQYSVVTLASSALFLLIIYLGGDLDEQAESDLTPAYNDVVLHDQYNFRKPVSREQLLEDMDSSLFQSNK